MNTSLCSKYDTLKNIIKNAGACAVAYSGGVDSTLVMRVAQEIHDRGCLAVIATSSTYSRREFKEALRWVREHNIEYLVIHSEELDIREFNTNPPNRCYYCKRELFTKIRDVARMRGLNAVLDGTNADDLNDYRPGLRAAKELGIVSPLREAGLNKKEIREISREEFGLSTAEKPAMACLASRFPYGSTITKKKLKQVESLEDHLHEKGLGNFRVRHHGTIVRIELDPEDFHRILDYSFRCDIIRRAKEQGFSYVTLDLEGYRMGSMNEALESFLPPGTERQDTILE